MIESVPYFGCRFDNGATVIDDCIISMLLFWQMIEEIDVYGKNEERIFDFDFHEAEYLQNFVTDFEFTVSGPST